jgi:hypothetical protein
MTKVLSILGVTALALTLMIYTAARALNFIQATLPDDRQVLAFFGLAALEGGMLFWLLYFLKGASGAWQRGIALVMVLVDFIGSVIVFSADTIYEASQAGMTTGLTAAEIKTILLGLSGIIALNIAAKIGCWIMSPEARKAREQEEAFDKIDDLAIKKISDSADQLAEELANEMAAVWRAETVNLYTQRMRRLGSKAAYTAIDAKSTEPAPAVFIAPPGRKDSSPLGDWLGNIGGMFTPAQQLRRRYDAEASAPAAGTTEANPTKPAPGGAK